MLTVDILSVSDKSGRVGEAVPPRVHARRPAQSAPDWAGLKRAGQGRPGGLPPSGGAVGTGERESVAIISNVEASVEPSA